MAAKTRAWWIAGIAVVAIGVVVVAVLTLRGRPVRRVAAQPTPVPLPTATPAPAGIPPEVTLSTSDPFVRQVVAGVSSNPTLATWLANKDLIRRFVAAVALVAEGKSPVSQLSFLRPRTKFRVHKVRGHFVASPSSFHRYDMAAEVFTSLDTAGTVEALQRLEPLIDQAYAQISRPGQRFRQALQKAIMVLLKTPSIPEGLPLKLKVLTYMYVDPRLERLSPAQRLLLRMGPANEEKVQSKLRDFAVALGIPTGALPTQVVYTRPMRRRRSERPSAVPPR